MTSENKKWLIQETEKVAQEMFDNLESYLALLDGRYKEILGVILAEFARVLNSNIDDVQKQAKLQVIIYQAEARMTALGGTISQELKDKLASISVESKKAHDGILDKIAVPVLLGLLFSGTGKQGNNLVPMTFETSVSNIVLKTGSKLRDILHEGIRKGWGIPQYTKHIQETLDYGAYQAKRIARTETSRVFNEAASQSYRDYGVTRVEWLATLEKRTCSRCAALHGKKYKMNDVPPIPLHPHCRCTTVPVEIGGEKL